jgi:hypothetical protein
MTTAEWERQRRDNALTAFPYHIASVVGSRLSWARPQSGLARVDFDILSSDPHFLIVTGDLGNAIYAAEGDFYSWACCNLDYFASRCVVSETGRKYLEWNSERAALAIEERWLTPTDENNRIAQFESISVPWRAWIDSEFEWSTWLARYAKDALGENWSDEEPWTVGRVISRRCLLQHTSLRLAISQLHSPTTKSSICTEGA